MAGLMAYALAGAAHGFGSGTADALTAQMKARVERNKAKYVADRAGDRQAANIAAQKGMQNTGITAAKDAAKASNTAATNRITQQGGIDAAAQGKRISAAEDAAEFANTRSQAAVERTGEIEAEAAKVKRDATSKFEFKPVKVKDDMGNETVKWFKINTDNGTVAEIGAAATKGAQPPPAPDSAIKYLKQHPEYKSAFKAKYRYLPQGIK